jgi:hypothetical protein
MRVFWMTCEECAFTQLMQPCEACPNGQYVGAK